MTQEEKQLLLKDLCARLPYGVKILEGPVIIETLFNISKVDNDYMVNSESDDMYNGFPISIVKPYLRPMSSMTEEEADIINKLVYDKEDSFLSPISIWVINESDVDKYIDFCLSHHLDFRGLIEKGLALEAPEGMYKTE